jgi:hypothetical protein
MYFPQAIEMTGNVRIFPQKDFFIRILTFLILTFAIFLECRETKRFFFLFINFS